MESVSQQGTSIYVDDAILKINGELKNTNRGNHNRGGLVYGKFKATNVLTTEVLTEEGGLTEVEVS